MNWYKTAIAKLAKSERKYSWVSVKVPLEISKKTVKFAESIPERELYIEESEDAKSIHGSDWKYGVEDNPHITAIWGISTRDPKKIEKALEGFKSGKVTLGNIDVFENEKYDVLKVNITSPALKKINKTLTDNFNSVSTFKEFHPHITLAYLKCGNGVKYKGDKFKGLTFQLDEVIFEDYNNKTTTIKLS